MFVNAALTGGDGSEVRTPGVVVEIDLPLAVGSGRYQDGFQRVRTRLLRGMGA